VRDRVLRDRAHAPRARLHPAPRARPLRGEPDLLLGAALDRRSLARRLPSGQCRALGAVCDLSGDRGAPADGVPVLGLLGRPRGADAAAPGVEPGALSLSLLFAAAPAS